MKKWFILLFCISCKSREVELMLIDKLTNGNRKEWKLIAFSLDGIDLLTDCNRDDTAVFIKISPDKPEPVFEYRKNALRCDGESDVERRSFRLSERQQLLVFDSHEEWQIEHLDHTELVLFRRDGMRRIKYRAIE